MKSKEALEEVSKRLADVPYQEEIKAIKNDLDRLEEIKKIVDRTFPHDMVEGMKQIKQLLEKE